MNSRQHDQNVFDLSFVLYVKKLLEYSRWFHFFVYLYNNFKKRLEIEVSRRAVFCRERGSVREFIVLKNEINGEGLVRLNMRAVEYGPIKRSHYLLPKRIRSLNGCRKRLFKILFDVLPWRRSVSSPLRGGPAVAELQMHPSHE